MTKLIGFVVFVSVAWGAFTFVVLSVAYGPHAPDWVLLPSMLGGLALGLWAGAYGFKRWVA